MRALLALGLMIICGHACGQAYTFRVLVNKGQNEMLTDGSWTAVKVGANLQADDQVRVSRNGYLGLVHVTGKPLELKDAGQYDIVDLARKIKDGPGVLSKYTDFILSREDGAHNRQVATGAVHRGPDDIVLYLPEAKQAVLLGDAMAIVWSSIPGVRTYVVQFGSMFGDLLDKIEVADTAAVVNLNAGKFREEDNIVIEVYAKDNPGKRSTPGMIKKISAADRKRIAAVLEEVEAETSNKDALSALIRAAFYEQHGLLVDAATAYREAIRLEPAVGQYRETYLDFLQRNGLTE